MSVFQEGTPEHQVIYTLNMTNWLEFKHDIKLEILRYATTVENIICKRSLMVDTENYYFWCKRIHQLQTDIRKLLPETRILCNEFGLYESRTIPTVFINVEKICFELRKICVLVKYE